ncbi:PREDICTED: cold-regulated 413 plasma membrane protein 2-like isoform X2 [Tarenaya hassleriana]|uniref:cold-regulated 413 plasma membrane protein 2-like isoform X2 n=1 Tax=Tarenaya hassleriana TaxID=28532 RepID=UPI00053C2AE9|nr:PREDICTED: cold-regulated 413 plasma membrane protein 2-like isoform X2 [Tarenaya hassleriana]XP_010531211.1 PREDICTED: cold-regulated 413 plasma membrane protein 2-like isoform X2 [Tarenaya hassleriana]
MTRVDYLTMMTDKERTNLIGSCLKHLKIAAEKPMNDAVLLGGLDLVTSLLRWVASFAAIYLLILDRTSWRTNTMTSLLAPYLFISLPPVISLFMRGEFGKWIALCLVVLRLFCPHRFPEWLQIPGALVLLLVAAPSFVLSRDLEIYCLLIGSYFLDRHVKSSGGYRNAFTERRRKNRGNEDVVEKKTSEN